MQGDWLARRVTLLEQRVERLETLTSEVAALRVDINAGFADLRERFALRADMEAGFDSIHQVLISLQTQITDNDRHVRVLYEELISRIATIGERWGQPRRPRKKR